MANENGYDKISLLRGNEQDLRNNIANIKPYELAIAKDTSKAFYKGEDGQLHKIVGEYVFDTIADLQSANYLKAGDIIEVLGYYTKGDGAGHKRIISSTDNGSGVVVNVKFANLLPSKKLNLRCFGITTSNVNCYNELKKAVEYNNNIELNDDIYIEPTETIYVDNLHIQGNGTINIKKQTTEFPIFNTTGSLNGDFIIEGIKIVTTSDTDGIKATLIGCDRNDNSVKINSVELKNSIIIGCANIHFVPLIDYIGVENRPYIRNITIKDNKLQNISSLFSAISVTYDRLFFDSNYVNNYTNGIISCGLWNGTNEYAIVEGFRFNAIITNNLVRNDIGFEIKNTGTATYVVPFLLEGNQVNISNNVFKNLFEATDGGEMFGIIYGGSNITICKNNTVNNMFSKNGRFLPFYIKKSIKFIGDSNNFDYEDEVVNFYKTNNGWNDDNFVGAIYQQDLGNSKTGEYYTANTVILKNNYIRLYKGAPSVGSSRGVGQFIFDNNIVKCSRGGISNFIEAMLFQKGDNELRDANNSSVISFCNNNIKWENSGNLILCKVVSDGNLLDADTKVTNKDYSISIMDNNIQIGKGNLCAFNMETPIVGEINGSVNISNNTLRVNSESQSSICTLFSNMEFRPKVFISKNNTVYNKKNGYCSVGTVFGEDVSCSNNNTIAELPSSGVYTHLVQIPLTTIVGGFDNDYISINGYFVNKTGKANFKIDKLFLTSTSISYIDTNSQDAVRMIDGSDGLSRTFYLKITTDNDNIGCKGIIHSNRNFLDIYLYRKDTAISESKLKITYDINNYKLQP